MSAWTIPVAQRVVYTPPEEDEDGNKIRRGFPIGVRIDMQDRSWWFCSFRSGSWTQHQADAWAKPATQRSDDRGSYFPGGKFSYPSMSAVEKEYGQRAPHLSMLLQAAYDVAIG
jgi:hypothetical protein